MFPGVQLVSSLATFSSTAGVTEFHLDLVVRKTTAPKLAVEVPGANLTDLGTIVGLESVSGVSLVTELTLGINFGVVEGASPTFYLDDSGTDEIKLLHKLNVSGPNGQTGNVTGSIGFVGVTATVGNRFTTELCVYIPR